jgi:DNA-binding transcriptional LysR family regulator
MGNIETYGLFLLSAQMGSISQAADLLFMEKAAANRKIRQLEHSLGGKKLLSTTNKGCELTENGRLILKETKQIVDRDKRLRTKLKGMNKKVLKIASTPLLISSYISYILPEFLRKNKGVSVELMAFDTYEDSVYTSYDVALFARTSYKTSLIQKNLFTSKLRLYASQEYIKKKGQIKKLEDLKNHQLIIFGYETKFDFGLWSWPLWTIEDLEYITPYITVKSMESMIRLSESGLGIIGISDRTCQFMDVRLENICPDIYQENATVCIMYAQESKNNTLVRLFKEHLYSVEKI